MLHAFVPKLISTILEMNSETGGNFVNLSINHTCLFCTFASRNWPIRSVRLWDVVNKYLCFILGSTINDLRGGRRKNKKLIYFFHGTAFWKLFNLDDCLVRPFEIYLFSRFPTAPPPDHKWSSPYAESLVQQR